MPGMFASRTSLESFVLLLRMLPEMALLGSQDALPSLNSTGLKVGV
jgi:hypothetical protein